jgi:WD40 repeat protein
LAIDRDGVNMTAVRSVDSPFKIQHAAVVGSRLVLCFENFLAVIPTAGAPLESLDLRPGSKYRIDDNWFSGLHTVFPANDDVCLVSSSGADAVLWVDLRTRKVIRRWRLPSDIYGVNYELTPAMSVSRHYIHNEIQLGHLNCAYPDGREGCYISTLAQGDIGHVDEDERYSLLARGYVGCHGVRLAHTVRDLYFSDSCSGRLMRFDADGNVRQWRCVDSRWLHDVEQADSDLYVFCMGDRNEVAPMDVSNGEELGRFAFESRGVNVQFVSVAGMD